MLNWLAINRNTPSASATNEASRSERHRGEYVYSNGVKVERSHVAKHCRLSSGDVGAKLNSPLPQGFEAVFNATPLPEARPSSSQTRRQFETGQQLLHPKTKIMHMFVVDAKSDMAHIYAKAGEPGSKYEHIDTQRIGQFQASFHDYLRDERCTLYYDRVSPDVLPALNMKLVDAIMAAGAAPAGGSTT